MATATGSAAVVDALNSLIEAEQDSIFRAMGENSPYLREASPQVRQALLEEERDSYRNVEELSALVRRLGGQPVERAAPSHPPMLEFISLKFLLPKLAAEKELIIRFYDSALRAIGTGAPQVSEVLHRQLARHREHLRIFREAASAG